MPQFISVGGEHYTERFNKTGFLVAFIMQKGSKEFAYPMRVKCASEHPLFEYASFGTAGVVNADSAGGGGASGLSFVDFKNAQNQYLLDPAEIDKVLHWFVGVGPSTVRMFEQYPLNQFRNSLPADGGVDVTTNLGIDGRLSPLTNPSLLTENWSLYTRRPVYNVYNPASGSQTPYLRFYPELLDVEWITDMTPDVALELRKFGRKIRLGGIIPVTAPSWMDWTGIDPVEVGA